MDGWVGYTATITVQYQLRDASGRPIWGAAVRGGAGGAKIASRSRTLATTLFQGALEDLAANAAAAFASPAFQQALAM
jgi:hypothetical protein